MAAIRRCAAGWAGAMAGALVLLAAGRGVAEDAYYGRSIRDLTFADGKKPTDTIEGWNFRWDRRAGEPRVVLDGAGEVYLEGREERGVVVLSLTMRAERDKNISGTYFEFVGGGDRPNAAKSAADRYVRHRFSFDPSDADKTPEAQKAQRERFLKAKQHHYQHQLSQSSPGGTWFRYQRNQAAAALGGSVADDDRRGQRVRDAGRDGGFEETFALASGGQAISENLQLDRVFPPGEPQEATVALEKLRGITIREFDWTKHVAGKTPAVDPLAALVPADQHAIFFASFAAMLQVADHADRFGTPVLRAAEPRSEESGVRARYERQLGLPSSTVARLLGPHLIASVAFTGGDPYLPMGSDVAVLLQAKDPAALTALAALVQGRVALSAKGHPDAKSESGEVNGVAYRSVRSPDRRICSYVASVGDAVVVTNSPVQLARIVATHQKRTPALSSLAEYTFFRDRYRRGDAQESGLLILSDATIRRWCGPKSRIADSRRVRAAAVLADLQAQHLEHVAQRKTTSRVVTTNYPLPSPGELRITPQGVHSSTYGSLEFMTPINELELTTVTQREANSYGWWRDGYQQNWSQFFDPIAVRFQLSEKQLAADVTVMPLIERTQYRELIEIARGAKLRVDAGDPHAGALFHFALAVNPESDRVRWLGQWVQLVGGGGRGGLNTSPLSWLGNSVSLYADADPLWRELAQTTNDRRFDFLERNLHRLPIGIHAEVGNALKMAAFLTMVRGLVDGSAPGLVRWDVEKHRDVPYVVIRPVGDAATFGPGFKDLAVYYVAAPEGFTLTPHKELLHRAIDRIAARRAAAAKPDDKSKPTPQKPAAAPDLAKTPPPGPWLGEHFGVRIDRAGMEAIEAMFDREQQDQMQRLAWSNLPILNEWRRMYPGEDPVAFHERVWQRKLVCPGGGTYRWNATWQTMESTVYGHPAEPKIGPTLAAGLRDISAAEFGVTFEPNGLRARAELRRTTEPEK